MGKHVLSLIISLGFCLTAVHGSRADSKAYRFRCNAQGYHMQSFDLTVKGDRAVMQAQGEKCPMTVDRSYRPTKKFEGYLRYTMYAPEKKRDRVFEGCRRAVNAALRQGGNSFEALRAPGGFTKGQEKGKVVLVYDFGDFHGQLGNLTFLCEIPD